MYMCHFNVQNLLDVGQKALMDRMKIIKKRLSMSLHSVRHVDDSLSELPEHSGLDEASVSRDGGEKHTQKPVSTYSRFRVRAVV